MVPRRKYEQDRSLAEWVKKQRTFHNKNELRLDRKELLDEIGFVWKGDVAYTFKQDDKLWHQQYEKLVKFQRKIGHCKVSGRYKDDKSLGVWVMNQRARHVNDKMLPDRKELLDKIGFVWKADFLATRSSTTDVRGLVILDRSTLWADIIFLTLVISPLICVDFGFGSFH
jgi:hypothetical protein